MAKLKDDQIRWILSLDAKGVQGELVQVSSAINKLNDENKGLQQEMKAAGKAMNEAAAAMNRLEDAGKTSTKQYQYATESYHSNAAALVELKSKIDQNNKSIDEQKAKFQGLTDTLKINDMTMNQLRQRAADLQKQMNNTSQNLDEKAYNALQKELEQVKGRMFDVETSGKSLLSQFASMHNPVGSAAKSVQGFGQALKALIANPVGLVIMAIAAAFYALKTAITGSTELSTKFTGVMNALGSVLDTLKRIVTEVVMMLINLAKMDFSAMKENINTIKDLGANLVGNAQAAYDAAEAEKALNEEIARNNDLTEVNKARIAELRQITQDSTKSLEERKTASKELLNLEKENYNMAVSNISKQYEVWKGKNKNLIDAMSAGSKQQMEEIEKYMKMVQEGTELTFEQRKQLANLVNDITSTLDKGTDEQREKFRSFFSDLSKTQQEYFSESRRDQKNASSLEAQERQKQIQAAKEALQKRLQDEENTLNQSINQLKESRLEGIITEQEYNKQVEQLTIESLHRKINIKGQEKDKILQLQSQLLDEQIKQQTEADKELLKALTDAKDEQLKQLDNARNTQLQYLQDTESDQKIYVLRAAELEAQTSKAREDIIRAFGITLENAEFQNNKIRLDAIEKNGKEITDFESKNLQEQANLRKLFAKTTADFERQYNIKSLQERMADELRIIEKQHDTIDQITGERLLSDEVYEKAKLAITKKYEDEKLKIRQQYGITSMSESYNSELKKLKELYDKELEYAKANGEDTNAITEEYEKAKLQIKLKYAEDYANKVGDFAKVGSDIIKVFSEAETATVSAEYTKRQSALTEQYNQGLISQEQYNAQKEQLDYEEKKKTLDIQKKYADVNFAMQAAEIISSGATAAINAYKALAGIPVVGPALGAAAATLVAITTAFKLKQAKAERDRVKSMTLEAPGGGDSSSPAPQTGTIQLKEGLAEGGPNMSDGGYTQQGAKYEVTGYLPVHGGEYVIASDELKQPVIADMARSIERERRRRTGKNSGYGFADGGSNTADVNSNIVVANGNLMVRMLAILDRLETGDIVVQTNYGITEMEAEQKRKMDAESKFTRT